MADPAQSFQALPEAYRDLIRLAEQEHNIAITPLQRLSGGWSGAYLYLVRVAKGEAGDLEHLILKLDHKNPKARSDEMSRHAYVMEHSPPEFCQSHIPQLAFDRVESGETLAIFYTIAGHSLRRFRTLASYRQQRRLQRLFSATNQLLLDEWNPDMTFQPFDHPSKLLGAWLGFRLDPGQNIESFMDKVSAARADSSGFLVRDQLLPNPLYYAREPSAWGPTRPLDTAVGRQHSDLNTNNILARFSHGGDQLDGYYLIDFALFKDNKPLLFDQRYLEMSYLVHSLAAGSYSSLVDYLGHYGRVEGTAAEGIPIEMAGVDEALKAGRQSFAGWVQTNHPSLQDDLWGQYWLAGTAAGLAYAHKAGQTDEIRLAGLIFAAANLKRFLRLFDLALPVEAGQLLPPGQMDQERPPIPQSPRPAQHNLPATMTNFIGRQGELTDLMNLVTSEARLISLTGPGGTGKTRLAIELGRQLLPQFGDGVYFIDLSGLSDPNLVIPTTAHTLGIREGGGQQPLEKLKAYLAERSTLLIFDNFEQVVEAAADLGQLLAACPATKALVTSRVPLQLHGEHEYPVPALDVPPELAELALEATEFEAVSLFRQQARAVKPNFEITDKNVAAVNAICRRVDGLPLALEIAAARLKMLPPEALLTRLDKSLDVLVSSTVDRPDRQQTLRGAIDWSYQLLTPTEQEIFTRLGIFAGGFTLEAAVEVCSPKPETEVFDGVETLLNNSLLRQVASALEEPRFEMLQTIREFALEQAAAADMLEELGWAHCQYFSQLTDGGFDGGLYGPDSALWLLRYEEEHDNLRQAISWALEHPEQGVMPMLAMMMQISWFWYRHGYLQEGSDWTEQLLAATDSMGESVPRAFALAGRGSLALWSGDLKLAARRTKEALEMGQRLGLDIVVAMTNMTHGTTLINQGKDKEAYPFLVNSVEQYDHQGQIWLKGTALVHLANVSLGMGDIKQALVWLDTAKPLLNSTGDIWTMAFGLNNYGEVARVQGDYEAAEDYYRRTEALYQQADSKGDQARLHTALGYIAQHKGDFSEAEARMRRSLHEFRKLGNQRGIAEALAGLAGLAAEQGRAKWATVLLAAAQAGLAAVNGVWWPADRVEIERTQERLQADLGDQFEAKMAEGARLPLEQAISLAEAGWDHP